MNYKGSGARPFREENPKGIPIITWLFNGNKIQDREHVKTSLKAWRRAIDIDKRIAISINKQTNYGILQMSADRLTVPYTGIAFQRQIMSLKAAARNNPDALLEFCQTEKFFKDDKESLKNAFRSITTCRATPTSESGVKCFGAWAMLCPGLNMELGLAAPDRYFASDTRKKSPLVCRESFDSILSAYRNTFPASGI
jgi:hypothetical protein